MSEPYDEKHWLEERYEVLQVIDYSIRTIECLLDTNERSAVHQDVLYRALPKIKKAYSSFKAFRKARTDAFRSQPIKAESVKPVLPGLSAPRVKKNG